MKKALSILISVMMVAGLFVALIPTASAATITPDAAPEMPAEGLVVYNEDFEGEDLTGKTDADLTHALGWVSAADIPDDEATTYNEAYATEGLVGGGATSIVYDEESGNNSVNMVFDNGAVYGWSTKIVDNDRLAGGDYIVEYTMTIDAVSNTSGFGLTIRNNMPWATNDASLTGYDLSGVTTYASHIKRTCEFDMHYKAAGLAGAKTTYDSVAYEGRIKANAIAGVPGVNYTDNTGKEFDPGCATNYSLIGSTNTFRTVVSSEYGVQNYVLDTATGDWNHLYGMDEAVRTLWKDNKHLLSSGINFVVRKGATLTLDDISVYTIADEADPTAAIVGYQTAAGAEGTKDVRIVGKIGQLAATDVVAEVRYEICVNEVWADVWLENAYKEISVSYGADAIVAGDGELLTALHVTGCPVGTTFSVTPYVTFADGATLIGEAMDFVVA